MYRTLKLLVGVVAGLVMILGVGLALPSTAQSAPITQEKQTRSKVDVAVAKATVQFLMSRGGNKKPSVYETRVVGNYALTSWLRGEAGGQALLRRDAKGWKVLAAGGGAMGYDEARRLGVPPETAAQLFK